MLQTYEITFLQNTTATSGNGITNFDIEKFFDNETNDDLKNLWVFICQIQ